MTFRKAYIKFVTTYYPDHQLTNDQLALEFPEWDAEKIYEKTGIASRHIAGQEEFASDMAVAAVKKIFLSGVCQPEEVDFILYCTQSPDYFLPTTACILQERLGLPTNCGALDFNLGCSGYVYGLSLAKGLIETGLANNILLITAETYSKYIHPGDKSVRTLFGDAASATLISCTDADLDLIGPFVFGTDGSGAQHLIVPAGGFRMPISEETSMVAEDDKGNRRSKQNLFMDGPEIFNFSLRVVPSVVEEMLRKSNLSLDQIDRFIFHQANRFMLEHLRRKLQIPAEKFALFMENCGNTVSSTIPIVLENDLRTDALHAGDRVMLVGFGVGLSWAATIIEISGMVHNWVTNI